MTEMESVVVWEKRVEKEGREGLKRRLKKYMEVMDIFPVSTVLMVS